MKDGKTTSEASYFQEVTKRIDGFQNVQFVPERASDKSDFES
jgi:hypothetical protein